LLSLSARQQPLYWFFYVGPWYCWAGHRATNTEPGPAQKPRRGIRYKTTNTSLF
jgi:hypothetical protein